MAQHAMRGSKGISRRTWVLIAVLALLLTAGAASGVWLYHQSQQGGGDVSSWFDPDAQKGRSPQLSEEAIRKSLNDYVDEHSMNVSIAAKVAVQGRQATLRLENIKANHVDQKVTLRDENGNVLYQSGALAPDTHIDTVELSRQLAKGEHTATATFSGYNRTTHEHTGDIAVDITLSVS